MIAWAGYEMFQEGYISDFEMTQKGKWPLDELTSQEIGWKRQLDIGPGPVRGQSPSAFLSQRFPEA